MKSISSPASNSRGTASSLTCLAALLQMAAAVPTTSYNTGSLGTVADGASTTGVVVDQPGAITAYPDYSSSYSAGDRTEVPFRSELNPDAASPFTIEFWAKPTAYDGDDAPIGNRLASGNRTGWVFFQRPEATGWNFRMYDGVSGNLGWDLTGGTSNLNAWSHVVVVWNGSSAKLYVNGDDTGATNPGDKSGIYNVNLTESFRVGALIGGASPYVGFVDDVAIYPTALTATQIDNHYATASSNVAGAYSAMVLTDGALLYLQQNPPSAKLSMVSLTPLVTTVSFTGVLAESTDLVNWTDLTTATSPYTPAAPQPGKLFFRAHR